MILAGHLLLPTNQPATPVRLARGWLRTDRGCIAEVYEGDYPHTIDAGSDQHVIMPGFIDAHLHLPQFDSIGADGLTLLDWLHRVIFPAEARWADADYAGHMTTRVARRLLSSGTTGVVAYATVHHAGAQNAMRALADAGLRGWVGQVLMDQQSPADLTRPAVQLLRECAQHAPVGRVAPIVTPRFAVSCSAALMAGAARIATERGWPMQTHLSELPEECALVKRLHHVDRYLDAYARTGLLTDRTVFAHAIHMDSLELAALAKTRAIVAHCPTANLFLSSGTMDRHALTTARVNIALGSDIAGGPDVAMPRVARAMLEAAKHRTMAGHSPASSIPTPAQAWWQITGGNAAILGWSGAGRLMAGDLADVVLLKPDNVRWIDATDPLGVLLYAWDDRWVRQVLTAGRPAWTFADPKSIL